MVQQFRVDPHHQHFLVIGAVEDTDPAAFRQHLVGPPQIIVIQLLGGRRLEAVHLAALRVDAGHHMLDGPILAGGVHGLKDEQQRVGILGVEDVLILGQLGDVSRQLLAGVLLVLETGGKSRVVVLAQGHLVTGRHHDVLQAQFQLRILRYRDDDLAVGVKAVFHDHDSRASEVGSGRRPERF